MAELEAKSALVKEYSQGCCSQHERHLFICGWPGIYISAPLKCHTDNSLWQPHELGLEVDYLTPLHLMLSMEASGYSTPPKEKKVTFSVLSSWWYSSCKKRGPSNCCYQILTVLGWFSFCIMGLRRKWRWIYGIVLAALGGKQGWSNGKQWF